MISNPIAWKLILLVVIQVIFVTMVYGPIAAYLVEAFVLPDHCGQHNVHRRSLLLKETRHVLIWDEMEADAKPLT